MILNSILYNYLSINRLKECEHIWFDYIRALIRLKIEFISGHRLHDSTWCFECCIKRCITILYREYIYLGKIFSHHSEVNRYTLYRIYLNYRFLLPSKLSWVPYTLGKLAYL